MGILIVHPNVTLSWPANSLSWTSAHASMLADSQRPSTNSIKDAPLHLDMIDAVKDLERSVIQSDCHTEAKLKMECPICWDSLLLTLDSVWVDYQTKVKQEPSIVLSQFTIPFQLKRCGFWCPFWQTPRCLMQQTCQPCICHVTHARSACCTVNQWVMVATCQQPMLGFRPQWWFRWTPMFSKKSSATSTDRS